MNLTPRINHEAKSMVQQAKPHAAAQAFCNILQSAIETFAAVDHNPTRADASRLQHGDAGSETVEHHDAVDRKSDTNQNIEVDGEKELEEGYELFGRLFHPESGHADLRDVGRQVRSASIALDGCNLKGLACLPTGSAKESSSPAARSVVVDFGLALERRSMKTKSTSPHPNESDVVEAAIRTNNLQTKAVQSEFQATDVSALQQPTAKTDLVGGKNVAETARQDFPMLNATTELSLPLGNLDSPLTVETPRPSQQIASAASRQIEQLVRSANGILHDVNNVGRKNQTVRLSLQPVELGAVDITVSRRGKRLEVLIVPELEATGRMLRDDAKQLLQNLGIASNETSQVYVRIGTDTGSHETGENSEIFRNLTSFSNGETFQDGQSRHPQLLPNGTHGIGLADDESQSEGSAAPGTHHRSGARYI